MMGHKEKLKGSAEYDALTGWRKLLKFRAGQVKKIKKSFWKRIRKKYKKELDFLD